MRQRSRHYWRLGALLLLTGVAAGCAGRYVCFEHDERLDAIKPLNLEEPSHAQPAASEDSAPHGQGADGARPSPILQAPILSPDQPDERAALKNIPLRLEEARAAALENNLDLRVQLVEPDIAQATISEEVARFQHVFTGAVGHRRTDPPPGSATFPPVRTDLDTFNPYAAGTVNPTIRAPLTTGGAVALETGITRLDLPDDPAFDSNYDTHFGLSLSQPLLAGAGRNVNTAGIRIAEIGSAVAHARTKLAAVRVLAEAERAYWNLYRAEKVHQVATQQVEIGQAQLRSSRRLIEAEQISRVDELRAEAGVHAREATSISAETNVRISARELKRVMQRPDLPVDEPEPLATATKPQPMELRLDRHALAANAIANRMEMFEVELQLLADAIRIAVEENQVRPRLDIAGKYALLGTGGNLGNSYDRLFGDGFNDWFIGLVAEVPLPLGRNQAAAARREQALLRQYQDQVVQERLQVIIRQDVYDAADRIEQNWQRIQAARRAVLAAEQTYRAELRLFEQAQRDSTDVLFAADRLATVQIEEINALADFEIAKVELALATGTTLGFAQVQWTPPSR